MIFDSNFSSELKVELDKMSQALSELSKSPKVLDSLNYGDFEVLKNILKYVKEIFSYRSSQEIKRIEEEIGNKKNLLDPMT